MSSIKRRVRILDHGIFKLFGMNVQLPALLELTEDQIEYIKASGLYKIAELTPEQLQQAKPTVLSEIEGDRFEHARTRSVNQLAFKMPIMGSKFAEKAKDAIVLKKNSPILQSAQKNSKKKEQVKSAKPEAPKQDAPRLAETQKPAKNTDKDNKPATPAQTPEAAK